MRSSANYELGVVIAAAESPVVAGGPGQLGQVRERGVEAPSHLLRSLGIESHVPVVQQVLREPQDAAAHDMERVVRQRHREATLAEDADHGIDIAHGRRTRFPARLDHASAPRGDAGACRAPRGSVWRIRRLPVGVQDGAADLADHGVGDAVEQVLLVAHVVVERHRVEAQLLGELAHAERLDAFPVSELDRGYEQAFPAQRLLDPRRRRAVECGPSGHVGSVAAGA